MTRHLRPRIPSQQLAILLILMWLMFAARLALAEAPPDVIRIGAPAVSGQKQSVMGVPGIARAKGWLEEEFKKEGTRFEFPGFKGGAATVNQAIAHDQIDFAYGGDLSALISRSEGAHTRVILPCGKFENAYLAVAPNSSIRSIQDLRGKRVAYFKGNYIHLQVIRILAANGMSEGDLKSINLDYSTAAAALVSGDVDAVFGGLEILVLRDRGIARVAYSTQGKQPQLTGQAGVLVREKFAEQYPQTTARLVKVWVKAALWASDPLNRDEVFRLWAGNGRTFEQMRDNYADQRFQDRMSPLLDPFFESQYQSTQTLARQLGLIRGQEVDIDKWFDRRYLDAALTELGLKTRWKPLDSQGRQVN